VTARVLVALAAFAGAARAAEPPRERVEKPEYVASLGGSGETRPWLPALAEVQVASRAGFHVNADYPTSFVVAPGAAELRFPRARIDGTRVIRVPCEAKAEETCGLKVLVPFFVARPGSYAVGGTVRFSVCDDDRCLIEKVDLSRLVTAR